MEVTAERVTILRTLMNGSTDHDIQLGRSYALRTTDVDEATIAWSGTHGFWTNLDRNFMVRNSFFWNPTNIQDDGSVDNTEMINAEPWASNRLVGNPLFNRPRKRELHSSPWLKTSGYWLYRGDTDCDAARDPSQADL